MKHTKTAGVYSALIAATAAITVIAGGTASASAASASVRSTGTWGNAQRISTPPTRPFYGSNLGSISCAPKGYCAALGGYVKNTKAFTGVPYVVTESKGKWSRIKVFDLSLLKKSLPSAGADLVACPSARDCTVIGGYNDTLGQSAPFTVNEKNGIWGKAHAIAGINAGIGGPGAEIDSLACTSAGNCVAGGQVGNGNGAGSEDTQPFVVSEMNGVWGDAEDLPGTSGLAIVAGDVDFISCTGTTCLGVGTYSVGTDMSSVTHQYVAVAKNGVWGTAMPIPGLPSDENSVGPLSCSPGGTCTVVAGSGSDQGRPFTVSEKNGTWNTRHNKIPGLGGALFSLACPSAGDCSADGAFTGPASRFDLPFVVTEHNGTWSKAEPVPGVLALSHGSDLFQASFANLSCGAAGNCAAIGYVQVSKARSIAYVVNEVGGRWNRAHVVPGIAKLEKRGRSAGNAIACWSAGHCAADGFFSFRVPNTPIAFVVTER